MRGTAQARDQTASLTRTVGEMKNLRQQAVAAGLDPDEQEQLDYLENGPEKVRTRTGAHILRVCRWIVANHSCREINRTLVDVQTANVIVQVHDALNATNREKYLSGNDVVRMGATAWRLATR